MPADSLNVEEITDDIVPAVWFWDHGIHVFPTINKAPAVKGSQFDYRCTREQAARFREYGVPGGVRDGYDDGLTIVDTDEDDDERWVAAQPALETPFMIRTRRGWHRCLRTRRSLPSYIHRDGRTIENRNRGLYVVGPGSVLPNGFVYRASEWSWRWEDIPYFPDDFVFDDGSCGTFSQSGLSYEMPEVVQAGRRHYELFRFLRHVKSFANDKAQAREYVTWFNRERCRPPLAETDARGEPDADFEKWFNRAWNLRDRPFTPADGLDEIRGL